MIYTVEDPMTGEVVYVGESDRPMHSAAGLFSPSFVGERADWARGLMAGQLLPMVRGQPGKTLQDFLQPRPRFNTELVKRPVGRPQLAPPRFVFEPKGGKPTTVVGYDALREATQIKFSNYKINTALDQDGELLGPTGRVTRA